MLGKAQFRELSVRHFQSFALCAPRGGGARAGSPPLSANFVLRDMASGLPLVSTDAPRRAAPRRAALSRFPIVRLDVCPPPPLLQIGSDLIDMVDAAIGPTVRLKR